MLPIAVLPIAGLLLGIGSSFTNTVTLENLGLINIIGPGTFVYPIFSIMSGVGSAIFDNLPLIFAIGVAIGMSKKEKETAALSAALSFLVMHITINKILIIRGLIDESGNPIGKTVSGMITNVLGIPTLQIGVFGGIVVGIGAAILHNKFRETKLPNFLAFFGGNRFVPIISSLAYIVVGIILSFIWPFIQEGIVRLGGLVGKAGILGAFLFDFIRRLLLPFGLHHVFYLPFWQTALGGTEVVAGTTYIGAQNILFAEFADPNTVHLSREFAQYFTGAFPIMIFAFPAACLAIYKNANEENRNSAKSLMISAGFTSFLTGITEPIEFPILFASPVLYLFNAVMFGLSNITTYLMNVTIGSTFSCGLIDFLLFGVLPGNSKTSWVLIIPIGLVFAAIYYFVFNWAIKKFDLKTPGREDTSFKVKINAIDDDASELIVIGLGGKENIVHYDCCATRLRVDIANKSLVNESVLRSTGALGVMIQDKAVQVIYGPAVNHVKEKLDNYYLKNEGSVIIESPLIGKYVKLEDVPDQAFATKSLGDGIAVDPDDPYVYAPSNGKIAFLFPTKHAIGFECDNGISLLIHLGIDTVELKGKGFEALVKQGDVVTQGTRLIKMDLEYLKNNSKSIISPIIVSDLDKNKKVEIVANNHIGLNEAIIKIKDK